MLLSGALNEPLNDGGRYVQAMLPRLYASCRKGLAFNLLNEDYDWAARDRFILQRYEPAKISEQLQTLSPYTMLRTDYLAVDASYFVWRDKKFQPSQS